MFKRILAVLVLGLAAGHALAQSPVAVIESAVDELSAELDERREELMNDPQAMYKMIDDILLPRFDRNYAAQLVLGRHWRTASAEQRQQFIDAFYQVLLQRYADGVLEFEQEKVEILPYRGDPTEKRTMVRTFVTLDDGTRVPINYALVQRDEGWQIFDVTVEGVSYVRNFRAEMNSEINAKGLAAVIERLESETANDASGGDSASSDAE
ncbi:MAG: ABC transporter substrate-binding protein [Woeseiaceae bacterium]|nr:ABC transporter substrate-binding protein [Woeseiaceae bacterium]